MGRNRDAIRPDAPFQQQDLVATSTTPISRQTHLTHLSPERRGKGAHTHGAGELALLRVLRALIRLVGAVDPHHDLRAPYFYVGRAHRATNGTRLKNCIAADEEDSVGGHPKNEDESASEDSSEDSTNI